MFINFGADSGHGRDGKNSWGERCLNVTRIMAISAAAAAPVSTAATSVAVALMLASWLASGRAVETLRTAAAQRFGQALLVFLALLAVDTLYSFSTWEESWSSLWSWRKLVLGLIVLGLFADETWKLRMLKAFLGVSVAGLAASYTGWLQFIPTDRIYAEGVFFTNHATQGIAFAVAALCCLELSRNAERGQRNLLRALALLFVLNVVFISTSRSAYAALVCVALVWGIGLLGWRRLPLVAGTMAVLIAMAFGLSQTLRDRVQQGINEVRNYQSAPEVTSAGVRVVFWKNTLDLVAERPVLGYGTGSFAQAYRDRFVMPELGWRGWPTTDPHNQYLFIAVENGLLGLAVFMAILVAGFREACGPGVYRGVIRGMLLAWCVSSLFNSHFRTFPEGHLIWLFAGAMLARAPLDDSVEVTTQVRDKTA